MNAIGPEFGTLEHRDALVHELCKTLKVTPASEVQPAWKTDVRLFFQAVEALRAAHEAVAAAAQKAAGAQQGGTPPPKHQQERDAMGEGGPVGRGTPQHQQQQQQQQGSPLPPKFFKANIGKKRIV